MGEKSASKRLSGPMDYQEILATLPHRYPFLLVDGILERNETSALGFKNVSSNEPYLCRKPGQRPRLPASLVIECLSQVGAAAILSYPEYAGKIMLFAAVEDLHFFRSVYAGDRLITRVERVYLRNGLGKVKGRAHVNNEPVAEGMFSFAIVDRAPNPRHAADKT